MKNNREPFWNDTPIRTYLFDAFRCCFLPANNS